MVADIIIAQMSIICLFWGFSATSFDVASLKAVAAEWHAYGHEWNHKLIESKTCWAHDVIKKYAKEKTHKPTGCTGKCQEDSSGHKWIG